MANPLSMASFPDCLDPRFREIFDGEYGRHEDMIPRLYTKAEPTQYTERFSALTDGPTFDDFSLTGSVQFGGPDQGYDVSTTYKHFAKGTQVEKDLLLYDQFDVIDGKYKWLANSAFDYQQIDAARIFNMATSVDTRFYTHSEGVALCSDSHTTPVAGVSTTTGFDNLITSALSPTSLKAAIIQFRKFKTPQGRIIPGLKPNALIVPIDLEFTAKEIAQTTMGFEPENFGDKTVNVLKGQFEIIAWEYLTDTNNWFLVDTSRMKDNLVWFEKQPLQSDRVEDFDTYVAKYRADMYYHPVYKDWRWVLGASVS